MRGPVPDRPGPLEHVGDRGALVAEAGQRLVAGDGPVVSATMGWTHATRSVATAGGCGRGPAGRGLVRRHTSPSTRQAARCSRKSASRRGQAGARPPRGEGRHADVAEEQCVAGLRRAPVEVAVGLQAGEAVQRRPGLQHRLEALAGHDAVELRVLLVGAGRDGRATRRRPAAAGATPAVRRRDEQARQLATSRPWRPRSWGPRRVRSSRVPAGRARARNARGSSRAHSR